MSGSSHHETRLDGKLHHIIFADYETLTPVYSSLEPFPYDTKERRKLLGFIWQSNSDYRGKPQKYWVSVKYDGSMTMPLHESREEAEKWLIQVNRNS